MKKSLLDTVFEDITLPPGATVLDVGCRDAKTLTAIKQRFPGCGALIGIDKRNHRFEPEEEQKRLGVRLIETDASKLDFADSSFDLISHKNTLECIPDIPSHIRELHRMLKPGGRILCIHCDWESFVLNGSNKALINKVIYQYANTLQAGWMDACDGWIGRRLWGYFHSSGLFDGSADCYCEVETDYREGTHGYRYVRDMNDFTADGGFLTQAEYEELLADMQSASDRGEYLFSAPYYIYSGVKK